MELLDLRDFLVTSAEPGPEAGLHRVDDSLWSLYPPGVHNGYFCFFHGFIHIPGGVLNETMENTPDPYRILIDLYITKKERFQLDLEGSYSIIIGNKESLFLFRDGNGCENLYFTQASAHGGRLVISNTIREISKHIKPEVNTAILPEYFIKTDINSGATFFRGTETLAFYEYARIDRATFEVTRALYDDFFLTRDIRSKVRIGAVISECDDLAGNIISDRFSGLKKDFTVINSLSGGTDSMYIQYFLRGLGSVEAWTANFSGGGLDHKYASDVAAFMKLEQTTVHSDTAGLISGLPEAVLAGEKPYIFAGESLLSAMYDRIGNKYKAPVACFDGTGAEGIYGASRLLYELRMLRKHRFLSGLLLPLLKPVSKKYYSRYSEFRRFTCSAEIPDNFILRYFTDGRVGEEVRKAFGLKDLKHIDDWEMSVLRRPGISLFESVYRYLAFELEYRRVNNIRTQVAKRNGILLIFPFTDHRLFSYLAGIDTEMKLRKARTKYFMRKALERKFPREFVYRKKIMKNVSVSGEILGNETVKGWIKEISEKGYPYFSFDYNKVFTTPAYSALAYKLINFHLWHRIFIDGEVPRRHEA